MSDSYERDTERKFCYFIKDYVTATFIKKRWPVIDGTWQSEEVGIECPRARKCRRGEHNCTAINPDAGTDPFIPFTNLLGDMW